MSLQITKEQVRVGKIFGQLEVNNDDSQVDRENKIADQMKAITEVLEENETLIRSIGGIPRLERGWAPLNAENNDLYQFRMSSVYYEKHRNKTGTFILYYRNPKDAGGINVFGMSRALETLQNLKFDPRFLYRLYQEKKITLGLFRELMKGEKFDLKVKVIGDGEFVGPNTPLMTVEGPLWQAQLVETVLLACLDNASGVATRMQAMTAISGKPVIDFGARRAPGEEAAVISALASICNGAVGVANTITPEVASRYGIEKVLTIGTTAHAFTESYMMFDSDGNCKENPAISEYEAYKEYAEIFPISPVVLIDTIKKDVGINTAARLYKERNLNVIGVRDDSNISGESVVYIHEKMKSLGVQNFYIVISDDLKPQRIKEIKEEIIRLRGQGFYDKLDLRLGVGTFLARPEPLGMVFKLAEWEEDGEKHPVSKASAVEEKASFPVVSTYRIQIKGKLRDINVLPGDEWKITNNKYRKLQKEVSLNDSSLRNLTPYRKPEFDSSYLTGDKKLVPIFTKNAKVLRNRIQETLKKAA